MKNPRTHLALLALAPLALVACSAKQQPFKSASSAEPVSTVARQNERPEDIRVGPAATAEEFGHPNSDDPRSYEAAPPPNGGPEERELGESERDGMGGTRFGSSAVENKSSDDGDDRPRSAAAAPGTAGPAAKGNSESQSRDADAPSRAYRRATPEFRAGLATQWGESRDSHVTSASFQRASETSPFVVGKLFYNDQSGIDSMLAGRYPSNRTMFAVGSGHLEVGLRGDDGRFITGFSAGTDNFVPGIAGRRYSIVVKNRSPGRMEVVASVDGLDVVDGRAASVAKRGYLMDPWGEVEIEGFRTSSNDVASFRFGSVGQSYAAQKHGDTRNVGVIGIAAFHERGDAPWRWSQTQLPDTQRRFDADPFPMHYASPPR